MKNNKVAFRYIDLFSGIGGFRIAIDSVGGKSVGFSEIDKKAIETYKNNFIDKEENDLGDVTKINNLPEVDLIVGGVPCQSWSVAGKRLGFEDPRGRLWYDAIRMVKMAKPKVFVFENVKGLIDPRNKANLQLIMDNFDELGYITRVQILNTYDFGVPQNRSRIFMVGFRGDMDKYSKKFEYPTGIKNHKNISHFLDGVEKKEIIKKKFDPHTIHGTSIPKSRNAFQVEDELNDFFVFCDTRNGHTSVHSWDIYKTTSRQKEIGMVFLKNRRKKKYGESDGNPLSFYDLSQLIDNLEIRELDELVDLKIFKKVGDKYNLVNSKNSSGIDGIYRVFLPNSNIFSTLTATGTKDYVSTDYVECDNPKDFKKSFIDQIFNKKKIRPITPIEAARIQGFPEDFKHHLAEHYAYKQFGNAVSPPVVKALMKQIISTGVFNNTSLDNKEEIKSN